MSNDPHYFGVAEIEFLKTDEKSTKGDYFAIRKDYTPFDASISINLNGKGYIETIPTTLQVTTCVMRLDQLEGKYS